MMLLMRLAGSINCISNIGGEEKTMPIVKNAASVYVEYTIPKDIESRIPDYFYYAMAGELVSIFGPWILEKQDYPEYDDGNEILGDPNVDGSYYDLNSSTSGWNEAFKMTCKKLNMMWLMDYYETLEWYYSDIFDGIIEDRIIENYIEKDHIHDHANCYYKYLCQIK